MMKWFYICNDFRNEVDKMEKKIINGLKFKDYEKVHLFSLWLYT